MTLNITISHKSGDSYAAKVQQSNKPDTVIQPGQSAEFSLWNDASTNLTISETSATVAEETGNDQTAGVASEENTEQGEQ